MKTPDQLGESSPMHSQPLYQSLYDRTVGKLTPTVDRLLYDNLWLSL